MIPHLSCNGLGLNKALPNSLNYDHELFCAPNTLHLLNRQAFLEGASNWHLGSLTVWSSLMSFWPLWSLSSRTSLSWRAKEKSSFSCSISFEEVSWWDWKQVVINEMKELIVTMSELGRGRTAKTTIFSPWVNSSLDLIIHIWFANRKES